MASSSQSVDSARILTYTSIIDPFIQAADYLSHVKEIAKQPVKTSASLKGRAIVLVGASSAGKSTIIHSLKTLDKKMQEEGADLTGAHFIYEFMSQNYQQYGITESDWEHLHFVLQPREDNWHIHDAIGGNSFQFLADISREDQERAKKTADKLRDPVDKFARLTGPSSMDVAIHRALEITQNDGSVAFDTLDVDGVINHPYSHQTHLTSVFVFCPFSKLTERLAERNRKALSGETGLNEVRFGLFPFTQYAELIRPKSFTDSEADVTDRLTKKEVIEAFDANFDAAMRALELTPEGQVKLEEIKLKDGGVEKKREQEKADFLGAFGFTSSDPLDRMISFVPRKQYDMIVDTSDPKFGSTPAERGNAIAKAILG